MATVSPRGAAWRFCARLSRIINRLCGGADNQTLCARAGLKWGHDCLLCRAVGFVLRDENHCWREMLWEYRRRAGK